MGRKLHIEQLLEIKVTGTAERQGQLSVVEMSLMTNQSVLNSDMEYLYFYPHNPSLNLLPGTYLEIIK